MAPEVQLARARTRAAVPKRGSRKPFLAVCGHANVDVQLQVKRLPTVGTSEPVVERRTVWGGTAANIARHAGGLGVAARLWSRVGPDFPSEWRHALEKDGVDLSHLRTVPGALTPTCFIFTDALDRQMYCMDQGAMASMAEDPPPPGLLEGLAQGGWLHLATGDPLAYAQVAAAANELSVGVALDPGQEMRFRYDGRALRGLLEMCDTLFVNEEELKVACGLLELTSPEEILAAVPHLVVTRGAKGASLYRRGQKSLHANAFAVERVVDPTGAGDAFRAGWYAALSEGNAMEEALRWGQAAAAVVVQHPGPQGHVVTRDEVMEIKRPPGPLRR
ncbi:MAG: carbohydrate kinase family protein [Thermoplasmatota archaeon]